MLLTDQEVDQHHALTVGPTPNTAVLAAYTMKRISSGSQTVELIVHVPTADVENVKKAYRAYFKPYMHQHEKVTCYLTNRSQKVNIHCKMDDSIKLQPKFTNPNLEKLITKLL